MPRSSKVSLSHGLLSQERVAAQRCGCTRNVQLEAERSHFLLTPLGNVLDTFLKDVDVVNQQRNGEIHNMLCV